jgi:hypothetical protein
MLEVVTPPANVAFTTLARVKAELGIPVTSENPDRDAWLADRLCDASRLITEELGRPVARQRVRQRFGGTGRQTLLLDLTPVVTVESIVSDDTGPIDLAAGTVRIVDPASGILWNRFGWPDESPEVFTGLTTDTSADFGESPYAAVYLGGWLSAADDLSGAGVTASGERFTMPAGVIAPLIASGEQVASRGWGNRENNRRFKVIARTDDAIVIDGVLVAEVGQGAEVQLLVRNMPPQFERCVFDTLKGWYHTQRRDPTIKSESIGDWSASYGQLTWSDGNVASGLPESVCLMLEQFRRLA